jgi:hypothetical protein
MPNQAFRNNPAPPCSSCAECVFLRDCGGLDGPDYSNGCFQRCDLYCKLNPCDCLCPCTPIGFDEAWDDVGGICIPPSICVTPRTARKLPYYVPNIHHAGNRRHVLSERVVAIPLAAIIRKNRRGLEIAFETHDELCFTLKLARSTQVLLSCIAPDQLIEDFWRDHQLKNLLQQVSKLNLLGMTVPNYSFMLDTPRVNSLYSLSRIFRLVDRMGDAGVPTVPHINASTISDWGKWEQIMKTLPQIHYVAFEFQTGLRDDARRTKFLKNLGQMMQSLGRKIHPIVFGGTGRIQELKALFEDFTVVDSTPFMKTVHRFNLVQSAKLRPRWRLFQGPATECLSQRLAANIFHHRQFIYSRANLHDVSHLRDEQLELVA